MAMWSFKKIYKQFDWEVVLSNRNTIIFAFFLITIRLLGIFSTAELPGWDNGSNLLTTTIMAEQFLPNGDVSGYYWNWLGGISLFQFYPPLFSLFIITISKIGLRAIPLALAFRLATLFSLFFFLLSFRFFTTTFLGKKTAPWANLLALIFIFFPQHAGSIGMGAGAAIWIGLTPSILGLSLVLLWLGSLKKISESQAFGPWFIISVISLGTLFIVHTMSAFVGCVGAALFFVTYWRRGRIKLKEYALSILLGIGLSAFWIIPFTFNLDLTASLNSGIASIRDPLLAIFPFNPSLLLSLDTFFWFKFWALGLFGLVVFGLYRLAQKNEEKFVFLFFITLFIFLVRDYIAVIFPKIDLYYHRLAPFALVISLSIAAWSLKTLWEKWAEDDRKKTLFVLLFTTLFFQSQLNFLIGTNDFNPATEGLESLKQPIGWTWEDYGGTEEGEILLEKLKTFPDVQRIYVELPPAEGTVDFGSLHYFTSQIPLHNNQAVITGLYIESSPLTPFIMPTLDALTDEESILVWGDSRLKSIKVFYDQPFTTHLNRLRHLGVNYIVAYSPYVKKNLGTEKNVSVVGQTKMFSIFRIADTKPLLYPLKTKPGLFINEDTTLSFRDVAMAIFAGQKTYDFPLAHGRMKPLELTKENTDPFSLLIVNGKNLDLATMQHIKSLNHPALIINPSGEVVRVIPPSKNFRYLSQLETIPKGFPTYYKSGPLSWATFLRVLDDMAKEFPEIKTSTAISSSTINNQTISFNHAGPVVINGGYSPYWQNTTCKECLVYEVTPANMLVFANGQTTITYQTDPLKRAAEAVSWISLALLIILSIKTVISNRSATLHS